MKENGSGEWKPCIFPYRRESSGSSELYTSCMEIDPLKPRGTMICPTRVNETTREMINGYGYWGECEVEHCPNLNGMVCRFCCIKITSLLNKHYERLLIPF